MLAYCLEYTEGIQFSRGLCEPDEAAVVVRDLTGALRAWIEIGSPDAARLHRAAKLSPRVVVYTHRDPTQWLRALEGEKIHRADAMELYAVDRRLVASLAGALERRMAFALAVAGGEVFVSLSAATLTGEIRRLTV